MWNNTNVSPIYLPNIKYSAFYKFAKWSSLFRANIPFLATHTLFTNWSVFLPNFNCGVTHYLF